jgi:hypothetical protein
LHELPLNEKSRARFAAAAKYLKTTRIAPAGFPTGNNRNSYLKMPSPMMPITIR